MLRISHADCGKQSCHLANISWQAFNLDDPQTFSARNLKTPPEEVTNYQRWLRHCLKMKINQCLHNILSEHFCMCWETLLNCSLCIESRNLKLGMRNHCLCILRNPTNKYTSDRVENRDLCCPYIALERDWHEKNTSRIACCLPQLVRNFLWLL